MRLFKRAKQADDVTKCPECGERIPVGALECSMCGHDLDPQHYVPQAPGGEARALARHWA